MNNSIVSIGTANPGTAIPQMRIADFMKLAHGLDPTDARKLQFVYRQSGIEKRYSVLDDFNHTDPENFTFFPKNEHLLPFPGTKARMTVFQQQALPLAQKAISTCLIDGETYPDEITHLILVSCTGMYAPGLEIDIIQQLGLRSSVERYAIHFMGCYASFNAIRLADRLCDATADAKVLIVSVELCTIHFQREFTEDNLLANAIFADGAAAALVCRSDDGLKIKGFDSALFPEGASDMAWSIGDVGFEMRLSKYVPELLGKGLHQSHAYLETKFNLSSISNFAIHPGGKQILQKVEEAFGIGATQNLFSHEVLRAYGNMSSTTILFVLDRWLQDQKSSGDILAMGFGPGLTLETLLLEK
ncbi:type III polyketide synthase [Mongoliitalea daihaiensis]|uniref:type III polyketide synthase n=1 Tax=Mongoliitalea daihaiensis TaxID=2782006 RepID=UPI001F1F3278|nr:type III polyketide synthase [Mongoliitalea daihaiensis]UJP65971.1 type III polyketide synthase [Mongoliitalea daihaiensis]